ncbi:MAG: DUF1816 domain-containing protein [Cyanobacteria bacterium P01_F01_bin.116]
MFRKSWWLEISTNSPSCVYYFGPFSSQREALQNQSGYVDDLEQEGGEVLQISVARRQAPVKFTVEYPRAA